MIDWCQYNPGYDPDKGVWIHYQTIKVIDNNRPVLSVSDDINLESIENNCSSATIEVPLANASDSNPDITITNNSSYANGSGANASGSYPFGMTEVTFTADANGNGKISTSAVLAIRRLVLSIKDNFGPDQSSWNFVPADYQFADPTNLFAADFQKSISYNSLSTAIYDANFIGIKIGDINNSAQSNLDGSQGLSNSANLMVSDQSFGIGEEVDMTLDVSNLGAVAGMQFVLNYDSDLLEVVDLPSGGDINLNESHFNLDTPGSIRFSWVQSDAQTLSELMAITLRAKGTGSLAQSVNIKENTTLTAEYYSDNSEINGLGLQFNRVGSAQTELAVYPNPFKEITSVTFDLSEHQDITLNIYDVSGKQIYQMNESLPRGEQRIDLSANLFKGAGVYYVQLQHADQRQTKKLELAY